MSHQVESQEESVVKTIIGWGGLGLFAIYFAWQVASPLIVGEQWANKQPEAIEVVKAMKLEDGASLYDSIRAFSLAAKEKELFVGEFSWSAIHRDGAEYEVSLLWSEGDTKKVAMWRVNLENREIRPQGDAAGGLPQRLLAGPGSGA